MRVSSLNFVNAAGRGRVYTYMGSPEFSEYGVQKVQVYGTGGVRMKRVLMQIKCYSTKYI
jgi:hypothetical protein